MATLGEPEARDAIRRVGELALAEGLFSMPGVRVSRPSTEQLLAMKLCAWRDDVDISDARRLLAELPGAYDEVWRRVEPFLQLGRQLTARYAFDDLWETSRGET